MIPDNDIKNWKPFFKLQSVTKILSKKTVKHMFMNHSADRLLSSKSYLTAVIFLRHIKRFMKQANSPNRNN